MRHPDSTMHPLILIVERKQFGIDHQMPRRLLEDILYPQIASSASEASLARRPAFYLMPNRQTVSIILAEGLASSTMKSGR